MLTSIYCSLLGILYLLWINHAQLHRLANNKNVFTLPFYMLISYCQMFLRTFLRHCSFQFCNSEPVFIEHHFVCLTILKTPIIHAHPYRERFLVELGSVGRVLYFLWRRKNDANTRLCSSASWRGELHGAGDGGDGLQHVRVSE